MNNQVPNTLAWNEKSKKLAWIAGAIMLVLSSLAMHFGEHQLLPFWQYTLPLLAAAFAFGMVGMITNHFRRTASLQTLPDLDYPVKTLYFMGIIYIYLFISINGIYFSSLLNADGFFDGVFNHWINYLLILISLSLVASGGGQVLISKQEDGLVYRDTVSKSKLSRQDIFFSLCGYWRDGFIIGWKLFPFEKMESIEEDKFALTVRGIEDDQRYALVIYTPRIQKKAREQLISRLKPY